MAGFRGVLARGDIGAAQETEFARCDIGIADSLCTPPECCGEQHRCAKPGSHSRQNPVPGLASRAFRIDQESGAVVVLGRKYRSSAKARPRPVAIAQASAVPAPPHGCDRTSASRSCVHRCRRFPVVGSGRRAIHVLVFFQVSHGSAPRLDANMGANGKRNINPGLSPSDSWSRRERPSRKIG